MYQGYCLLDEYEYEFMEYGRDVFPEDCQQTANVAESGNLIYYGTQPRVGGGMGIGLYEDRACSIPYFGDADIEDIVGDVMEEDEENNQEEITLSQFLARWNQNLETFKTCQPCKTYDLSYVGNGKNNGENGERKLENENANDANQGNFLCQDATGGQGANQCMVFAQQTQMTRASYNDISLATRQDTIVRSNAKQVGPSWWSRWGFLLISILVFLIGMLMFCSVSNSSKRVDANSEPLLQNSSGKKGRRGRS